jgi:predicted XRE-type DNA-binding protein
MPFKKTHGLSNTRLYKIFKGMKQRCFDKNFYGYSLYGGSGITICKEWQDDFKNFYEWAVSNGYSDELSIDRINPKGDYEPSNCRWVTQHEQILNQDRNKHRTGQEKYIKQTKVGRWQVQIQKSRKCIFQHTFNTLENAIKERDHFLKTGEFLDIENQTEERLRIEKIKIKNIKYSSKISPTLIIETINKTKLSQAEIAKRLSISESAISKVKKRGSNLYFLEKLEKLIA